MADAARVMAKFDGKNARYQAYRERRKNGKMTFFDILFKSKSSRLYDAGVEALPTFQGMAKLRTEAGASSDKHKTTLRDLDAKLGELEEAEKQLEMAKWLFSLETGRSQMALHELAMPGLFKQICNMAGAQIKPLEMKTDNEGIVNMACRAAGAFTKATGISVVPQEDALVPKNYMVNQVIFEMTVGAMLHASLVDKVTPSLDIYQTDGGAIVVRVKPRVNEHAETLLRLAESMGGFRICGNSVQDGGETSIYLKESK